MHLRQILQLACPLTPTDQRGEFTLKLTPVAGLKLDKTDFISSPDDPKSKDEYYVDLAEKYRRLRDMLLGILERHQFTCYKPYGAYYIMTDISGFGFRDDVEFARFLGLGS